MCILHKTGEKGIDYIKNKRRTGQQQGDARVGGVSFLLASHGLDSNCSTCPFPLDWPLKDNRLKNKSIQMCAYTADEKVVEWRSVGARPPSRETLLTHRIFTLAIDGDNCSMEI